jgi:hypothetical protein
MKNHIRTLAVCGSILALGATAQAQNIVGSTSSTSAWLGSPVYQTGAGPNTDSGGTTQDNDSWGGNANGTAGFGALGQAFEVTTSGTLGSVELSLSGSPMVFNVELYNLGPAQTGYQAASGNPPQITQINTLGSPVTAGSAGTYNGGPDLLAAGDQFTFAGVMSGNTLETLTFGGADSSVSLIAGDIYVLSLDPTNNADNTWWQRGGLPASAYNTGEGLNADGVDGMQAFEGKSSVRDFDLAVTEVVPEPATMALFGLGTVVGTFVLRRRKQ